MSKGVADLPNLGPKSAEMLAAAGIHTLDDLAQLGTVKAYVKVKQVQKVSLNLLYAMEGALTNMHWAKISHADRVRLTVEVESLEEAINNGLEFL